MWITSGNQADSEDESDTDSVEEVQITKYLNKGFLAGIQQARACAEMKMGIKREPGHYHLRDKTHAVIVPKIAGYEGTHWDVPVTNNFQRATRRLSAFAIEKEVAKEQLRRTQSQADDMIRARRLLVPVNAEYWDRIEKGLLVERERELKKRNELETVKDETMCELMRKHNMHVLDEELEKERERQVAMVTALNNMSEVQRSPSLEEMVTSIADTNHRKSIVQQDLTEAFARFEEDEEEADAEYRDAMLEMMDESLNTIKYMFNRGRARALEEEEQERRVAEQKRNMKDKNFLKARRKFAGVMGDLRDTFNMVESQEASEMSQKEQVLSDRKELVLQELRRMYAKRWVERMSARERKRRIKEAEHSLFYDDPARDRLLRTMARVQRQMILQKFAGKWINLTGVAKNNDVITQADVEHDRDTKLKAIRLKARRQSCVTCGEES